MLRDFSAPVRLDYDYQSAELIFLMKHDRDAFNRWDAGQRLAMQTFLQLLDAERRGEALGLSHEFIEAFQAVLNDEALDHALRAEALTLPSLSDVIETVHPADPEAIYRVREFVCATLAKALRIDLETYYEGLQHQGDYAIDPVSIGRRRLKNVCLGYLGRLDDEAIPDMCARQYYQADNMSDALAALMVLTRIDCPQRLECLQHFHDRWEQNTLVMDKWFALQASSTLPDTLQQVQALMHHPRFDLRNPNKVRALIGSFAMRNPLHFHAADGGGYRFLAEQVMALNDLNPQIAARLVRPLMNWRQFEGGRSAQMKAQLERIQAHAGLSVDVLEIVSKSLAAS
ncbi:MAG: aminopeptidase N C-terminal domain-containing protein [Thiolinea sp.]